MAGKVVKGGMTKTLSRKQDRHLAAAELVLDPHFHSSKVHGYVIRGVKA